MNTAHHDHRPLVGITTDLAEAPPSPPAPAPPRGPTVSSAFNYARAVGAAGGLPILLPPIPDLAGHHARLCEAFVFTGGDDPRTEPFGHPTHPKATPMHPQRQAYELALLAALRDDRPLSPVLGICLGMQLMSLHAGGRLNQHLPDTHATADDHRDHAHPILVDRGEGERPSAGVLARGGGGLVTSRHRQAVDDPGNLRVIARAHDGVIEAVADRSRPFYLGVQWHPERTPEAALGAALFEALVGAVGGSEPLRGSE